MQAIAVNEITSSTHFQFDQRSLQFSILFVSVLLIFTTGKQCFKITTMVTITVAVATTVITNNNHIMTVVLTTITAAVATTVITETATTS